MSVTIGSISAALLGAPPCLSPRNAGADKSGSAHQHIADSTGDCAPMRAGVSAHAHKNWGQQYEGHAIFVRSVSLALMVLSIFMAVYAAYNFHRRGEMLQCVLFSQMSGSPCCMPLNGWQA